MLPRSIAAVLRILVVAVALVGAAPARPATGPTPILTSSTKWKASGGTAARSLAERAADVANVRDFGAKCDATWNGTAWVGTDDTAAFAAAYAALGSNGGTIRVPAARCRMNLTVAKPNVTVEGDARGASYGASGATGSVLVPASLTAPVLQLGDGTTATVYHLTVRHLGVAGEKAGASSDGLVINGAAFVNVDDVSVADFGRDNVAVRCGTQPVSFVQLSNFSSRYARGGAALRVNGCAGSYTSAVYISNFNLSGWSTGTVWALALDSAQLYASNGWVQAYSGRGVELRNTYSTAKLHGSTVAIDSDTSTDVLVNNLQAASTSPISDYIDGSVTIDGRVQWNDAVQVPAQYMAAGWANPRLLNGQVVGRLNFPLNETEAGAYAGTVYINRSGATGGSEVLNFTGASPRFPMTYALPLAGATNGAIWRDAVSGMLRYRGDSRYGGYDYDGVPLGFRRVAPTYGASIAIDAQLGTQFDITATNSTAFTITAPTHPPANDPSAMRMTIRIRNASGGALGTATWNAAYKMAAWTQPANGFSRAIDFQYDGTNWVEVSRTPADVPN